METLTPDENLIAHVARATCFAYRIDASEIPEGELQLYVDELIALFRQKPHAVLLANEGEVAEPLATALVFCAEELAKVAPAEAVKLRIALVAGLEDHGAT